MKPKQVGVNQMTGYDVEPRTGKPFNSIKVQVKSQGDIQPKGSQNIDLDTQAPYTNWRKEFDQRPDVLEAERKFGGNPNFNPLEEGVNNVGVSGKATQDDRKSVKRWFKK